MRRRTPLLAILLAPVVTVLAVLLWKMALVPLYRSLWFSDTAVQWRLSSDDPQIRSEALRATAQKLRDLHSRAGEEEWIGKTANNHMVVFPKGHARPGQLITVLITSCRGSTLRGTIQTQDHISSTRKKLKIAAM